MSTNYYFNIDLDKLLKDIDNKLLRKYLLNHFDAKLHIGKRSIGWKPVFEKTDFYSSVQEIRDFYNENKNHLAIVNEYGRQLTLEELEDELIDWNKENADVKEREVWDNRYQDSEGYDFIENEFW